MAGQGSIKLSALLLVLVRNLGRWTLLWIMYTQAARSQANGKYREKKKLNHYRVPGFGPWLNSAPHQAFPNILITRTSDSMRTIDLWVPGRLDAAFERLLPGILLPRGPNPPAWPAYLTFSFPSLPFPAVLEACLTWSKLWVVNIVSVWRAVSSVLFRKKNTGDQALINLKLGEFVCFLMALHRFLSSELARFCIWEWLC